MANARQKALQAAEEIGKRKESLKTPSGIYNTYYNLPDTIQSWYAKSSAKGEEYFVDLVMFPVGPNFPWAIWKQPYKVGDWAYTLIADIHKDIGPEGQWVLCPKNNYGERCPVCEDMQKLQSEAPDKEARKKIWEEKRTYRRQMYYIVVRDDGEEEDKGVQFWEVPAAYMHDKLDVIKYSGRGGDVVMYWHPDKGKTIKFKVADSGEFAKFDGHQFIDRIDPKSKKPYVIEDEFLEFAENNPIDRFLKRMTYDEVAGLYYAKDSVATTEESPPSGRRRRKATEETPPPVEPPKEKEPEPEPEPTGSGAITSCPSGLRFGVDTLKEDPCEDCEEDVYLACKAKKEELEAANPPKRRRSRV